MDDLHIEATFDDSQFLKCFSCGRIFTKSNAYSVHVGSCRPQKKRMAGALELAKEMYRKKKTRLEMDAIIHQPQFLGQLEHGAESQAAEPIIEVSVQVLHLAFSDR